MKVVFITCSLLASLAFAETPATTQALPTTSPMETCKGLVTAATNKDFSTVQQLTLMNPGHKMNKGSNKGFGKMHEEHLGRLKNLNCKTETVAMDRAFVETESEGGKRLIPFVKTDAGWRFDAMTYMSFYDFGPKHMGKKGKM